MNRIAVVMPHFPSQTHTFYWREIVALREIGIGVEIVSTTRPPSGEVCHPWSDRAQRETTYLTPVGVGALLRGAWSVLRAGPVAWARTLAVALRADGAGLGDRLRILAMIPISGLLCFHARRLGVEHFHAHSCGDVAMLTLLASRVGGHSYSMTLHGPLEHYGCAQGLKWRNASFGIAVSRRLRDEVLAAVGGLDPRRVEVVSMGVDTGSFVRAAPYAAPAPGGPWRVVSCGRLHPAKGHQDVIRAVAALRGRGRDVRLTVLGEGPARHDLEALIAELGLTGSFTLAGAVGEDEVRSTLERSDLFALGSHDEAVGVATMEAMAMGLPVVVTDVGGVPELVEDGVNGVLVPPRDPDAMADAIDRVLSGDPMALGIVARRTIVDRFDCRRSAEVIAHRLGSAGPFAAGVANRGAA